MKRVLVFLTAFLLCCIGSSYSQSLGTKQLDLGIKGGINFASFTWKSEYKREQREEYNSKFKPQILFNIGGYANYSLTEALSLQGGLSISGKGYKETWTDTWGGLSGFSEEVKASESLFYLEIPVNVVYHYKNFYAGAGPYFGYGLLGIWKLKTPSDSDSGNAFDKDDEGHRRVDFGAKLQAGYRVNDKISVGLEYGLGLTKLYSGWNDSPRNGVFSISLGYWF
ncbi:porin family protein [Agriterribacter sp.]|uniref:porin family protein n=1 Tax=Agriterribacter sp. TaxID=2821509 RepID=UPI002CA5C37E|nr:porin family protein [Agriterribacter sp.]HRP58076.1 porin family protein [Agriterribacter sp.]